MAYTTSYLENTMRLTTTSAVKRLLSIVLLTLPVAAASLPSGKPEEVGLSADRLQRIHQMIQRHIDAGDISGAVTLVARKGRIAHLEAHGLMNLESKKPMATDAIFRIASMSKPITGVAILMLMEDGKVRLNDPVSKFIPEFKEMKVAVLKDPAPGRPASTPPEFYTVPAGREITIRDLLTHTSGLVSGPIGTREAAKISRKPGETLADYIPRLGAVPLDFQPGSRWSYSPGAGFDTLGRVVEIISGQNFDEFLRQRIFEPLGIKEIFFNPPEQLIPRMATIYRKGETGLEKQDRGVVTGNRYFSGAGGLASTTGDYAQFSQMLLNGGQLNGQRLLSPKTVELMSAVHLPATFPGRPPGRSWGLSVQVISDAVAAGFRVSDGSFGWDGAFGTHFWVDPKEKMVGILMVQTSNGQVSRDFENAVMQAIIE